MVERVSKNKIRGDIQRKTEEFLSRGGEIKKHERGETGEPADKPRAKSVFVSSQPRQTRTYINDVVSALDSRKKKTTRPAAKPMSKSPKRARKKIVYDDFGEPLREVWTDDEK
ncbi:hypothetical protein N9P24_00170 [bacterium]|nr:hypothetical protein [bacterium]